MKQSKQRAYQIRMLAAGRCPQCGKPLTTKADGTKAALCPVCLKKRRDSARERYRAKRDAGA